MTGTVLGLGASIAWMVSAVRRRHLSVDVIAVLALAGALAVDEPFAGAMITVMLASGQLLEARAAARARRELGLLLERSPRTAQRRVGSGVAEIPVDAVARGDRLLVGTGELVPVDGRLLTDALLDESALTGEPLPVERRAGDDVRSGVVNAGTPVDMVATAVAAESTYAGLVRLVEQAQAASAPFVRVADRLAVFFVPLTLLLAVRRGRSAAIRSARSRCSWSRRLARCCSPPRSRSSPGCRERPASVWWSRAVAPWSGWPPGG